MPTPFDKRILWLHWMGDAVGEATPRKLAQTVKQFSPNAAGIAIKTSDGAFWQGKNDTKKSMAISGPAMIKTWATELAQEGLETHLWCVVRGQNVDAEASIIIQACNVSNVADIRSMILDVEVGPQYFGSQTADVVRRLIRKIRDGIPPHFHLALCFDYRGNHPRDIFIQEWLPSVQSLHPMVYHWEFSSGTSDATPYLDTCFRTLAGYNLPIVPMLQAYDDPISRTPVPPEQIADAGVYAMKKGAAGLTYFRLGTAGAPELRAVARIDIKNIKKVDDPIDPDPIPNPKAFQVVTSALNVRTEPTLEPRTIIAGAQLRFGETVQVDPNSRIQAEDNFWLRHTAGWSAEKSASSQEVFMLPAGSVNTSVAQPAFNFVKSPLDVTVMQWLFYYGNTVYAYNHRALPDHNYIGYSQGLHGGLDLGHPGGVDVRAGVRGKLAYKGTGNSFTPYRVDVAVDGTDYVIIYGHLANKPLNLALGSVVEPDTVLGSVDFGSQHVHLEIRYKKSFIYNPLLFMPDALRNAIITRFPPTGTRSFYTGSNWDKWRTPLDQPVIMIGGPMIGPP
ncbi:MAG: hypothetical protein HY866_00530 [Chloroflexi bacterium]|nr:hypothetical protein [Chloroflexota bacterium]